MDLPLFPSSSWLMKWEAEQDGSKTQNRQKDHRLKLPQEGGSNHGVQQQAELECTICNDVILIWIIGFTNLHYVRHGQ